MPSSFWNYVNLSNSKEIIVILIKIITHRKQIFLDLKKYLISYYILDYNSNLIVKRKKLVSSLKLSLQMLKFYPVNSILKLGWIFWLNSIRLSNKITKFFAGGELGNSNLTMFSMPKALSCKTGRLKSVLCISGGVFKASWNAKVQNCFK